MPQRIVQRLDGEGGGVSFARGQSAEGAREVCACESGGVFERHALEYFGERGAAGERGRAAVGEEARGFDATMTHAQGEAQAVAADRIREFGVGVCVCDLTCAARVREMIFEGGGVGHG